MSFGAGWLIARSTSSIPGAGSGSRGFFGSFVTAADGNRIWPLDSYLIEGRRLTNWFAPGVVKHHRTIGTYVTALLSAGFTLTVLQEWGPSDAQLAEHPGWVDERQRPPLLLVAARRV
mgnify:CR=1 FL=1